MKKNKPKSINEIVADLRSRGELDEEKWARFEQGELSRTILLKQLSGLGGIILFLVIIIVLYFDSYSSVFGIIFLGFACFMAKREVDIGRLRNIYLYNLGKKETAEVVKMKYLKSWIRSWRIIFRNNQKEETLYLHSKGDGNHPPFKVGQKISIFVDPNESLTSSIFFKEDYDKFNLKKDNNND